MKNVLAGFALLLMLQNLSAMQFVRVENVGVRPQLVGKVVPRANFFKDVMANTSCPSEQSLKNFLAGQDDINLLWGYKEFETSNLVALNQANLVVQSVPSLSTWLGFQDDITYQCGSFEQCSIQELQDGCIGLAFPGGGTFNVVEGIDTNQESWFRHHVDIGALQADPANRDAVFQVASNFNGLETVGPQQNIEIQLLEEYIHDLTQGPAASISAAPGLILRHYFMYYDPNGPRNTWPQTIPHHVNFLDELADVLPVSRAGYVVLPQVPGNLGPDDYQAMKVGFHGNVQVTHGFMLNRNQHLFIAKDNPDQIINQVFTAAIDLAGANGAHVNNPAARALACHVLNAAYEGTLRKAFVEGKQRVFLTMVGGGVFGNDHNWIFNAINRMSNFIQNSGLEVTLIFYNNALQGYNPIRARFVGLVNQTGGRYQQFRHDGVYRPGV